MVKEAQHKEQALKMRLDDERVRMVWRRMRSRKMRKVQRKNGKT